MQRGDCDFALSFPLTQLPLRETPNSVSNHCAPNYKANATKTDKVHEVPNDTNPGHRQPRTEPTSPRCYPPGGELLPQTSQLGPRSKVTTARRMHMSINAK